MKVDKIKQLTHKEHVFKRPSMYVGDTKNYIKTNWLILDGLEYTDYDYNDAYFKLIFEVLENSVDEYIKTKGKYAKKIKLSVKKTDDGIKYKITDTGRGISTELIDNVPAGVIAFTKLMSGSNFDDNDRNGIGMNGVGVSLTNLFSKKFEVVTYNHLDRLVIQCQNNMDDITYHSTRKNKKIRGTSVSFILDGSQLDYVEQKMSYNLIYSILRMRLIEIKTFFPDLKLYINDEKIEKNLLSYLGCDYVKTNDYILGIQPKKTNECNLSYVNGINTSDGGDHLDKMQNYIFDYFADSINRKHKIDIKSYQLKKYLLIIIGLINYPEPNFIGQYKSKFKDNKFGQFIIDNNLIIDQFLQNYFNNNRTLFDDIAYKFDNEKDEKEISKIIKDQKKRSIRDVAKFIRIEKHKNGEGSLFIAEGDSAIGSAMKVRNNREHAFYALGGKFINVFNMREVDVRKSSKVNDLLLVLGIDLRSKNYLDELRFKNINILTDGDVDGNHISMLLIIFFYKYFPDILSTNRLRRVLSPVAIARQGKEEKIFYSHYDFLSENLKGYRVDYYKGLGSYDDDIYRRIIHKPKYEIIDFDDKSVDFINDIFSVESLYRKQWLEGCYGSKGKEE